MTFGIRPDILPFLPSGRIQMKHIRAFLLQQRMRYDPKQNLDRKMKSSKKKHAINVTASAAAASSSRKNPPAKGSTWDNASHSSSSSSSHNYDDVFGGGPSDIVQTLLSMDVEHIQANRRANQGNDADAGHHIRQPPPGDDIGNLTGDGAGGEASAMKRSMASLLPSSSSSSSNSSGVPRREYILVPSNNDILLGRGSHHSTSHPGNLRFHSIIQRYQQEYDNQNDTFEKTVLVSIVVGVLKNNVAADRASTVASASSATAAATAASMLEQQSMPRGPSSASTPFSDLAKGRFLAKDNTGGWYVVTDDIARLRVSQAFRNQRRTISTNQTADGSTAATGSPRRSTTGGHTRTHSPPSDAGNNNARASILSRNFRDDEDGSDDGGAFACFPNTFKRSKPGP